MGRRVELLAPAGNYEAFLGAVNAGADAVYLGGDKYGARAYADNFTQEEICRAIHTAHFMGKKVYLTVNTLVKDVELSDLYDWLLPLYESGLDGVIVQDIGVLCYIREHFEGLALHASTQMTLTGTGGAEFLKRQGVERVVPARELSLEEVHTIKKKTALEIECFIHGAMCFCYSGQCLFSSMLGGRSGNRGRCAQPCRLPYGIYEGNEHISGVDHPLSLKDMCTISYIPRLIESGIDSLKIEGRMKKPEYAAGVTAIYRKYINLYEEKGSAGYHVSAEDMERIRSLYIRSELQTGYYERYNGKEMITTGKPGYEGSDPKILEDIRLRYVKDVDKLPIKMHVRLTAGDAAELAIESQNGTIIQVSGDVAEAAQKMPLKYDDVQKHMEKTGNSLLKVTDCNISMDGDVFLPVRALNELRRKGVETFERQYIMERGMIAERRLKDGSVDQEKYRLTRSVDNAKTDSESISGQTRQSGRRTVVDILVSTCEQFAVAARYPCRRIYIESDLYLTHYEQISEFIGESSGLEYYLALPYILRARDEDYLHKLDELLAQDNRIHGFLIRNYEEAEFAINMGNSYEIVPDANLYVFNCASVDFWLQYCNEFTIPRELNAKEIKNLINHMNPAIEYAAMIVYGRIPMMICANCVRKTADRCRYSNRCPDIGSELMHPIRLKDRYGSFFAVETNCMHCYNIIYNSVPCSLHLQQDEIVKTGVNVWRYDFTDESGNDCARILEGGKFPYEKYTTGHFKRGVE